MRIAYRNFTGGEVSPTLTARYDLARFGTSVQTMENFIPGLHGDVQRRPGLSFVADLGEYSVLIPFSFNVDADQNFCLILSAGKLRVSDGRQLLGVSVSTPYAAEDLVAISWAQVGDIIYLAHRKYPLHKIMRTGSPGAYQWRLAQVALNTSLTAPAAPSVSFVKNNDKDDAPLSYTLRYRIVAVDKDGLESLASPAGAGTGKHPADWVTGNYVSVTWQAVQGAVEYNVYREEAGYYGFIGVASGQDATGRALSGIRLGALTTGIAHYSGSQTREIVISNGYTGTFLNPVSDKDVTSPLTISANSGQNAFLIDGKAFVWTTKTTTTTEWIRSRWQDESGNTYYTWDSSTTTATEQFWAMVPCNTSSPAGQYTQVYTGSLGSNTAYPQGTVGALTVSPTWTAGTTLTFLDNNYEADIADTPKEDWNPFAGGNNPGTVSFHQQRMVLGGTKNSPQSFYMSRTGDFENFRKSRPLQDDDPVEYVLASGSIDAIQWIASFGDLLIGTSGAEYKATGESGVITAQSVHITSQSYWGSSGGLTPLIIGNSILHVQRHGARVRDLFYSLEKDGYAGNDLSIMAPHLFENHAILQWTYQQTPGSNIWCVRDDGVLLCLTYMKEHEIYGWSRHLTDGRFVSVMSMSGEDSDVVLCVVQRMVGGTPHYFLERLGSMFGPDTAIEDAFFVDCGITRRAEEASDTVTGLDHLEGRTVSVLADGSPVEGLSVSDGAITLPYPARTVHVGLPYASRLALLPVETDAQTGSTLGKRRAYGKCLIRVFRSVGGKYGPREDEFYDFPFLPARYDEPCEPFSGDLEFNPGSGQAPDTTVWLVQDRALPFHVVAVMCDVDFGEV